MPSLQTAIARNGSAMFLFTRKREKELARKEAQIEALKAARLKKEREAREEARKISELINNNPGGIAELIWYATGGFGRNK
jgi:hypothetical protein